MAGVADGTAVAGSPGYVRFALVRADRRAPGAGRPRPRARRGIGERRKPAAPGRPRDCRPGGPRR